MQLDSVRIVDATGSFAGWTNYDCVTFAYGDTIHDFYTLEGANALAEALRFWEGGKLVLNIVEMPIKCPVAPLEFIFLADAYFQDKGIRDQVDLTYVTPLDGAFTKPIAAKHLGNLLEDKAINLESDFYLERVDALTVRAGAGLPCTQLARQCIRWGLGPSEFFAGIPGTVGGALAMNAGAHGGETWERVASVRTIDRSGQVHERAPTEYSVGYRSVTGPANEWFVEATFRFEADVTPSVETLNSMLERRKSTQPLGLPSCGSVFRNPPGDYSARLIEAAGLKGFRIGGAEVSEKHANFIINRDNATAKDIEQLIEHVRQTVLDVHGVELVHEVRIVGEVAK